MDFVVEGCEENPAQKFSTKGIIEQSTIRVIMGLCDQDFQEKRRIMVERGGGQQLSFKSNRA